MYFKEKKNSSMTDLSKYLDIDSISSDEDPQHPLDVFSKTLPKPLDFDETETQYLTPYYSKQTPQTTSSLNSAENSQHFSLELLQKYRQQSVLLTKEVQNLTKELKISKQANEDLQRELQSGNNENSKLKKVVKYVMSEVLGDSREYEYEEDLLTYFMNKFSMMKAGVLNTQKAYFQQKEICRKLKEENAKIKSENYSNLELILRMNNKKADLSVREFCSAIEEEDTEVKVQAKHGRHRKTNSLDIFDNVLQGARSYDNRSLISKKYNKE